MDKSIWLHKYVEMKLYHPNEDDILMTQTAVSGTNTNQPCGRIKDWPVLTNTV